MTLTTHGVVGAAAAVATTQILGMTPVSVTLGVVLGFASHFALDALPHWDEGGALLRSVRGDASNPLDKSVSLGGAVVRDILIVGLDALIGLALSALVFALWLHAPLYIVLLGAVAGQAPDGLQFIYFVTHLRVMRPLQKFHHRLQHEFSNVLFLGIEIALIVASVATLKILL